ncbi:hypothetical protein N7448_002116 [Penicillium atrosanguineum]|uniref:Uncharacterized protein n=1 Tax=Penicillium atrosanguineum TaxID=1132637 RepID=A0A9W9HDT7_9EURO|nr:hypothetical protein N7526_006563 [Penicillium atrosanguineum]KAJ5144724.1 hypothetical protein N7448_002116 [Penicillium atrosanguineum]KAJ5311158.1 hypothetical protein N7476_007018 [Penicillium atrosanguineum]
MPSADPDSDSDVEFEDVLSQPNQSQGQNHNNTSQSPWIPTLSLPDQRDHPATPGSEEENQLRGRLTAGLDRINYRQMKAEMGIDTDTDLPPSERRYENFQELAHDINTLIDMLWVSATPSIQTEALLTLAGLLEKSLKTYPFTPYPTLGILHKFDSVFVALCTGRHPLTNVEIPGAHDQRQVVTQTQKVRIRSLAETTRNTIFGMLPDDEEEEQPWLEDVARVYDGVLMLLEGEGEGLV